MTSTTGDPSSLSHTLNLNSAASDSNTPLLPSATYDPSERKLSPSFDPALIGSPLKRQRASLSGVDSELRRSSADVLARGLGFGYMGPVKSRSDAGLDGGRGLGGILGSSTGEKEPERRGEDEGVTTAPGGSNLEIKKVQQGEDPGPVLGKSEPELKMEEEEL